MYLTLKLVESGLHLNSAYDKLRKLERQYVHKLPRGLRNRLHIFLNDLGPVVIKYGDAHDKMYGSDPNRLPPDAALNAANEIKPAILRFRDYCRRKLDSIIYRSLD